MRLAIRKDELLDLYVFCMHWHSGKSSRGYRILSRIMSWSKGKIHVTSNLEHEIEDGLLYDQLRRNYGHLM